MSELDEVFVVLIWDPFVASVLHTYFCEVHNAIIAVNKFATGKLPRDPPA